MAKVTTLEAAEAMLASRQYHTAATLGKLLNITPMEASGLIYNIRHAKKYTTVETPLPNRKVKVLDIEGRCKKNNLWAQVLGLRTPNYS